MNTEKLRQLSAALRGIPRHVADVIDEVLLRRSA